jgi:hypothetical protein
MIKRDARIIKAKALHNTGTHGEDGYKDFVDLNFKVTAAFHKRFRLEATLHTMSLKDLLGASFQAYLDTNGGTISRPAKHLPREINDR